MIIYSDIVSGDEVMSDTWRMKEVDGAVYEVDSRLVSKVIGGDVVDIGANPSAEEAGDDTETRTEQVVEACDAFRLSLLKDNEGKMSKKEYMDHLKKYMKAVTAKLKERGSDEDYIKSFQTAANKYSSKILANFKNYDQYQGSSSDPEGMHVLVDFREDGVTPYLTIWKHALVETKV